MTTPKITWDDAGEWVSDEKWVPVRGFEETYEISDRGAVKSITRSNVNANGVSRTLKGRIMKSGLDGEGYPQVGLLKDGLETKVRVHRLVAEGFIPNPKNLPVVDHINRNRRDNRVENLRWASFSLNRRNTGPIDMKRLAESEASA